jgi:hypothetical protein
MKIMKIFKTLILAIIFFGALSHPLAGAKADTARKGITTFRGKLQSVGANSDKFLIYTRNTKDPRGFTLTVSRYLSNASTFTVNYTKLLCATGEEIAQQLFGMDGDYYVGNIILPDNKYLVFDFVDNERIMAVDKIPKPLYSNYTWLIFHCIQLDQWMFWPLFRQTLFFQKWRVPDVIDVILFRKEGTDGQNYVYWRFINDENIQTKTPNDYLYEKKNYR